MPGFELIGKEEQEEINDIFDNGGGILFRHSFDNLRNNSYKVKQFEEDFKKEIGSDYALAVSSGTAALRVALSVLDLKKDDEVITQSFTFVATVEAIIESGAKPICAEIDTTLNLSPIDLLKKINSKTKAVIVVHMLGTPANLIEIKKICDDNNIALIEDAAWGCGGSINKKYLGTWGRMGAFSFDFAKTITTGEGGMVTFKNKKDFIKAAAWHDHGHENNPNFPRWEDTRSGSGFNFRMSELQGAVGIAQLKKLKYIVNMQNKNKDKIWNLISPIKHVTLRSKPENSFETADALIFLVKDAAMALDCRNELLKFKISTKILPEAMSWHFAKQWEHIPEIHNIKGKNNYSESEEILSRCVSIPIFVNMPSDMPAKIKNAIESVAIKM